jgi:hypothetical protein
MFRKRGQGALEFIMTYGWALVITIVVIGALVFFFGWDDSSFIGEYCKFEPGLFCKDATADQGSISLVLKNSMGKDLENVYVFSEDCDVNSHLVPSFKDSEEVVFYLSECDFSSDNVFEGDLNVGYNLVDSSITHEAIGDARLALVEGYSQGGSGGYDPGSGGYNPDGSTLFLLNFNENYGSLVEDLISSKDGNHIGNTRFLGFCDNSNIFESPYDIYPNPLGTGTSSIAGITYEGCGFDGKGSLRLENPDRVFNEDEGTWEMWVSASFSTLNSLDSCLFEVDNDPGLASDMVVYKDTSYLKWGDGGTNFFSYVNLPLDDIWTHVAFTWEYDGSSQTTIKGYIDGNHYSAGDVVINGKLDPPEGSEKSHLGRINDLSKNYTGGMDEIGIYSKALSASEILDHKMSETVDYVDWSNGALEFDGMDDWLRFQNIGNLGVTQNITIEAWIKPYADQSGAEPNVLYKRGKYKLFINSNNQVEFGIEVDSGTQTIATTETVNFGEWNHISGTFNGTNTAVYLRNSGGGLIGSAMTPSLGSIKNIVDPPYVDIYVGNWHDHASENRCFKGLIDNVRISDYVRYV